MTHRLFAWGLVVGLAGVTAGAGAQTVASPAAPIAAPAAAPAKAPVAKRAVINSSVDNPDKPAGSLSTRLPDVKLDRTTFADAVDFLREVTNANIHVNWRAIEGLGISKDTTVSLRVRNVPVRTALKLILADVSPDGQVTYYTDEGIIEITTKQIADSQMITRVYNVRDLLVDVPDFTQVQSIQLQSSQRGTIQSGGGGGGNTSSNSSSVFSSGNSDVGDNGRGGPKGTYEKADDLVALIKATIQPEIWRDNGGTATISYFNGSLVVTAPRSVHEALAGYVE